MAQDVVVLRREAGGAFVEEFVTGTSRAERLDVVLHVAGGRLWLDWKHGDTVFGCAEFAGTGWSAVQPVPWADPTWVGVEETRKLIQNGVVGD